MKGKDCCLKKLNPRPPLATNIPWLAPPHQSMYQSATVEHESGLRVFLGALIHGVPATANLHNALTCSGNA